MNCHIDAFKQDTNYKRIKFTIMHFATGDLNEAIGIGTEDAVPYNFVTLTAYVFRLDTHNRMRNCQSLSVSIVVVRL